MDLSVIMTGIKVWGQWCFLNLSFHKYFFYSNSVYYLVHVGAQSWMLINFSTIALTLPGNNTLPKTLF